MTVPTKLLDAVVDRAMQALEALQKLESDAKQIDAMQRGKREEKRTAIKAQARDILTDAQIDIYANLKAAITAVDHINTGRSPERRYNNG